MTYGVIHVIIIGGLVFLKKFTVRKTEEVKWIIFVKHLQVH